MITISLCMIVKNEEDVLARCLASVSELVEEIVIVDTGSDDRTAEIAREFTDRVYSFAWIDDFSAARNFSFSKATMDYVMWLDADDVLLEKDRASFLRLKETLPAGTDMVMMKYDVAFDGQGRPTMSYYRERLMRREAGFQWTGPIHEVIAPAGRLIHDDTAVSHKKLTCSDPDRNLRIFEKVLAQGGELDARQTFYYARELYYHARYEEAAAVFRRFLEDDRAWLENRIEACRNLAECLFRLDRPEEGLAALLRSFGCDVPRAEICCDIGRYFFERERFREAAYWYEQAKACTPEPDRGGFCQTDCYGYLPCIQLCVCYDRLGDAGTAEARNEEAGRWKPEDAAVLYNRRYFADKKTRD